MLLAMARMRDTYTHGHHESVLRSHLWRTVDNSAAYVVPHLQPGTDLLDVGCGPGNLTVDFAARVVDGAVVGVDNTEGPLEMARQAAALAGVTNVSFEAGDAYGLRFEAGSFDVVHAHQVLQHLSDPVAALREMRRVCRPDGVVAARDVDFAAMTWYPAVPGLDAWLDVNSQVTQHNGGEPDAGRRLRSWARAAGFAEVQATATAWCFSTPEERAWWGGLWAERVMSSSMAEQAIAAQLATPQELQDMSRAWRSWSEEEDGWFAVLHGEILCRA